MKIAENSVRHPAGSELDIQTIRRRVAKIKNRWTPEEAQTRAAEGARRRRELDAMVTHLLEEMRNEFHFESSEAGEDSHGLTLVG